MYCKNAKKRKEESKQKIHTKKQNEIQLTVFKPLLWQMCTEKTQNFSAAQRLK